MIPHPHPHPHPEPDPEGPTADELAAIDAEWPLIEAELALLDAEIHVLFAPGGGAELAWRRLRRAERAVLRAALRLAGFRSAEVEAAA